MSWFIFALITLSAYCLGSLSFAIIVSKIMNLPNPHTYGSGNPGATNVLRSGNKTAAILTLILDAFKGWIAVYIAYYIQKNALLNFNVLQSNLLVAAVILAVFLGHLLPIFYQFKGGKGVATAAGILIAIQPLLGGLTLLIWLIVAVLFRYSSLAALSATVFAALYALIVLKLSPIAWSIVLMCALLIGRHQSNIKKLINGQESKIGQR